jgi:hypothetical protein
MKVANRKKGKNPVATLQPSQKKHHDQAKTMGEAAAVPMGTS